MNRKLRELAIFTCLYAVLAGFAYLFSKGLPFFSHLSSAIIILLATFISILPYYFFKNFQLKDFLPEFILCTFYSFTRTLLAYIAYHDTAQLLVPEFDVAEGPLIFASLVFVRIFYSKLFSKKAVYISNIFYIIILNLLTLPIMLNIVNFILFRNPLTINAMQAILQTNITEAWEYISNLPASILLAVPLTLIFVAHFLIQKLLRQHINYTFRRKNKFFPIITFITALATICYSIYMLPQNTKTIGVITSTQQYFSSIKAYKTARSTELHNLKLTSVQQKSPHTIILVIGESATRDYMKAFNESMADDTTPWLTQLKNDDNMLLFPHAYACAHATVPTLEHALTEANYYNDKEFHKSLSIIDIAKKAGYKTYWFSNQGK